MKGSWECTSVVESLPSVHDTPGSSPSNIKKGKKHMKIPYIEVDKEKNFKGWGCALIVECLPNMCNAGFQSPAPQKQKTL